MLLRRLIPALLLASTSWGSVVVDVRTALDQGNLKLADALVARYRAQYGVTPEMLEALSWLGRGALAAKQLDRADAYARQTQALALEQLKKRTLDAEPHLPLALGAAIEVQGNVLNARGERAAAVALLRQALATYRETSIRTRIQKDLNLLELVGKPAPPLDRREFVGLRPPSLAALKGKPVLLFFWAHWCPDCKAEEPILAQIAREFAGKGLVIVAPTQRYGYAAQGEDASPAVELKYIAEIRRKYYQDLLSAPAPVSEENFKNYGASTTPTLVLIDRRGIVRLYHPGAMTLEELRAALERLG